MIAVTAALQGSGAAGVPTSPAASRALAGLASVTAPERCPWARAGLVFYRVRYSHHRRVRGVETPWPAGRKPQSCPDARYLADEWQGRARAARETTEEWIEEHTLVDYSVREGNQAWARAVREVQRLFPGTEAWLLSCSAVEGGHGRWVRHGGGAYYRGYEFTNEVGNWMQYRWGTFRGHYRSALEWLRERSYRVPRHLRDPGNVRAWLSPLGAALAAGWARYTGADDRHWEASWNTGC